jgi:hypothetical protein
MREGGGGVERREWVFKNGGGGTARGSDSGLRVRRSRRVMAEIILGAWVRVGCREGKIGRRNRQGD